MLEKYSMHLINRIFQTSTACLLVLASIAQDYTTPDQYTFRVDTDLIYGVDTNYLGLLDTLKLDVYTPNGNTDTKRPLIILVHGGNWLGGCKDDPSGIVPMAHQFVKRGYVVASINYRLGWHKSSFVSGNVAGYGITPWPEYYRAFYALDSAEIKRAIFRGQQDAKGAIRFMKARADMDSVCIDKAFIGGESAGGFVSLAAAFLDRSAEKPVVCNALPDAPMPYAQVLNMSGLNCITQNYNEVNASMLARPDLGSVDGDLNINGFDARVKGVLNFFGGVPQEAFTQDWWQGIDTPAVYLYHQTADGIVLFGNAKPFATMSNYCNLGSAPWHFRYPTAAGSGAIKAAFDAMLDPPFHATEWIPVVPFDYNNAVLECARYANNGSYHYIVSHAITGQNVADFLAPYAADPGACLGMGVADGLSGQGVLIYPQPATDILYLRGVKGAQVRILDQVGRDIGLHWLQNGALDVSGFANGMYVLVPSGRRQLPQRFVVAR